MLVIALTAAILQLPPASTTSTSAPRPKDQRVEISPSEYISFSRPERHSHDQRTQSLSVRTDGTTDAVPDLKSQALRRQIAEGLLGRGFDVWTNKPTPNRCVTYPSTYVSYQPAVSGVPSQFNWSEYNAVHNLTEHTNANATAVSATVTYNAFSLGASHADASANHYGSLSSYIDVDKGVVGDAAEIIIRAQDVISPSPVAIAALKSSVPTTAFANQCGQAFISRVLFGQHIVGSMDFVVTLDSSAKSNSTAVSVGVASILGASASTSSSSTDLSQKATIAYHVRGAPAEDPDPAAFLKAIRDFGKDGVVVNSNQWVLVETTSYKGLSSPIFAHYTDPAEQALGSILTFRASFTGAVQDLSDLLDARGHEELFDAVTPAIDARVTDLSTWLDDAGRVYKECAAASTPTLASTCALHTAQLRAAPHFPPLKLK